jgi:prefoldin subunit 5
MDERILDELAKLNAQIRIMNNLLNEIAKQMERMNKELDKGFFE